MMSENKLNILCLGSGAIGIYIGGSLQLNENKVIFLDQPTVVENIISNGLTINIEGKSKKIPNPIAVDSIQDERIQSTTFDLCIFAIKSFDTRDAAANLSQLKSVPPVLCLQNGVENEAILESFFGAAKVIPGTVTSAVGKIGKAEIILEKLRGVGISNTHPLSQIIFTRFNQSGLNAQLFTNPFDMKWSKMLTNLMGNASSAILDMKPFEIFSNKELFVMEIMQLKEALSVMKAFGIKPINLPSTPVRWLAFAVQSLPLKISQRFLTLAVGGGRGEKMPSLHLDFWGNRGKSEVDFLNGAVVRFANKVGIPTPVNQGLNEILDNLVQKRLPQDEYRHNPNKLLKDLHLS